MKAQALKMLDEEHKSHKQAWINHVVKDTKTTGKKTVPVYKKFTDFFDYQKLEKELLGNEKEEKQQDKQLMNLIKLANKKGG